MGQKPSKTDEPPPLASHELCHRQSPLKGAAEATWTPRISESFEHNFLFGLL